MNLEQELTTVLNKHSRENASNTPDFLLAQFMLSCLAAFEYGIRKRDGWYGISPRPGGNCSAKDVSSDGK